MARILIIDDDAALLASLGSAFEAEGYTALTISDLGHARQLYAEQQPDLVILEVRASHDQGWELISEFADTLVMVVSAAALEEDVVRGLDAGACDYIAKPYRTRELLARVRSRLGQQFVAQPVLTSAVASAARPEATDGPLALPPIALVDESPADEPPADAMPAGAPPAVELPAAQSATMPPPAAPRPAWVTTTTKPLVGHEPRRKRPKPDEEPVFISEADELALLSEPMVAPVQQVVAPRAAIDEPPRTIGQRLRNERLRRQLTLVQIENEIRVRISYLQAMEDDKFTLIPRGPSSQLMLKTYAEYLGIDSTVVLDEFRKTHYTDVIAPLPALGGTPLQRNIPRWLLGLIAILLALGSAAGVIAYLDPQFFVMLGERMAALWGWLMQFIPG